jgi:ankyrin repeat protein
MSRVYFTKLTDLEEIADSEDGCWDLLDTALSNDMEILPYTLEEVPIGFALYMLPPLLIPHWATGGTAKFGQTYLHYAALRNCSSIVKWLITEHKYTTESLDVFGNSPLITAVQSGSEQTVYRLVSCGAQVNLRDAEGFTALHHASKGGTGCPTKIGVYCRMIQVLLDGGADVNARCMQDGSTALHMAAKAGHIKIVVILLRCGAIYDLEDVRGYTPLHLAVTKDANLTLTAILSACGASPHSLNHINGSPLHDAFKFCVNPEHMVWEMLCYNIETDFSIPDNDGNTLLHKSAPWKRLMGMCLRQDFDCDINKKNKAGNTPLHHIAITGQKYRVPTVGIIPAMQVLLDDGAWMETRNNVGMTVLESASLLGLQDVIDLLDKEVETRQSRKLAVAMALHKRLGAGSLLGRVDEEVLNMVLEVGKIE